MGFVARGFEDKLGDLHFLDHLFVMAFSFVAVEFSSGGGDPVAVGAKLSIMGALVQPLLAVGMISVSTSDSQKWRYLLGALLLIFPLIGTAFAFFIMSSLPSLLITGILFTVLSVGILFLYARLFDRSHFDLVPTSSTSGPAVGSGSVGGVRRGPPSQHAIHKSDVKRQGQVWEKLRS